MDPMDCVHLGTCLSEGLFWFLIIGGVTVVWGLLGWLWDQITEAPARRIQLKEREAFEYSPEGIALNTMSTAKSTIREAEAELHWRKTGNSPTTDKKDAELERDLADAKVRLAEARKELRGFQGKRFLTRGWYIARRMNIVGSTVVCLVCAPTRESTRPLRGCLICIGSKQRTGFVGARVYSRFG